MTCSTRPNRASWAIASVLALALAGCGTNPYPDPPAPLAEAMGKPPVTETPLIWQPGHWDWNGSAYVWRTGVFVARAGHSDYFQSGRWDRTSAGWRWEPAHWLPLT